MDTEKRKAAVIHNQFFILQLLAVVRRYKKDHAAKDSATVECACGICVTATKLISKFNTETKFRKKQ